MKDILGFWGRQNWLNELGEAYEWLETERGFTNIYKAFQKALTQVGTQGLKYGI